MAGIGFQFVGTTGQGYVSSLTDLSFASVGGQIVVIGATHVGGGTSIWGVTDANGLAEHLASYAYSDNQRHLAEPQAVVLDRPSDLAERWERIAEHATREQMVSQQDRALRENCAGVQHDRLAQAYGLEVRPWGVGGRGAPGRQSATQIVDGVTRETKSSAELAGYAGPSR